MSVVNLRTSMLFINPGSTCYVQAAKLRTVNPAASKILDVLGGNAQGIWVGGWMPWTTGMVVEVNRLFTLAAGKIIPFVIYNIPDRDLGNDSAGGAADSTAYKAFIDLFCAGLAGRPAIVVLEPDATSMIDSMTPTGQAERYSLLAYAVEKISAAGGLVLVDCGDSGWQDPAKMADKLIRAGVLGAHGIASNVSHFRKTVDEHAYCQTILAKLHDDHGANLRYMIDSGRNGNGPYEVKPGQSEEIGWQNPPSAGCGIRPSLKPNPYLYPGCDGWCWFKGVASSDGDREGAPPAGSFYLEQAVRHYWQAKPTFPEIEF